MRYRHVLLLGLGALSLAACKTTTSLAGGTGAGGGSGGASTGTGMGGSGTGGTGGAGGGGAKTQRVDLLFSIDNSRSMSDKQEILSLALDDLITGLTNPPCLDDKGNYVSQPGALTPCPDGSARQFEPVRDIHVGVVSSSLGGHGSDACSPDGSGKGSNNDRAHLLSRKDPITEVTVQTYDDLGFLAWDPAQVLSPPGEMDPLVMTSRFRDMVLGVGQIGCGYEAQLESWYRFLVEPNPPGSVGLDQDSRVIWKGTDELLLAQRKAFLRPDSMVVVVMLTDENDCSIREEGQYYFVAQQQGPGGTPFHLPRPRAICATDPGDACCLSCGQPIPVDGNGQPQCPEDPSCKDGNGATLSLDEEEDAINLRCFDQKRRFGIDFLYPVSRYVDALTSPKVTDHDGNVVDSPLFSDLDPTDDVTAIRDPGLVLLAGIVGVPWQDIAKNKNDLKQGFKTAGELTQPNEKGQTTWDIVLGDPDLFVPPLDPFMVESVEPRSGVNPLTGDAITMAGQGDNKINGHEFSNPGRDDIQFACVMPVPTPHDCSQLPEGCDCADADNDSPLCEPGPGGGNTLQVRAKAYPGLRQLAVLKGLGDRAVIGSICATQLDNPSTPDYAYRPAVSSLIDRMKSRLQ